VHKVSLSLKKIKKIWTGWGCHPVVISKTKWEPDDFIRLSCCQLRKTLHSPL